MKALSIKQPFAALIVHGIKDIENRTWKTNYRGKIYIHASAVSAGRLNNVINAIKSHAENHPDAFHFTEDIKDFNVVLKLKKIVDQVRTNEPNSIINIWASLECTNFSSTNGGALPKKRRK